MFFAPALLLSLTGFAAAQICIDPLIFEGTATFFAATGQTACGNKDIPKGAYVAGLPAQFFDEFQPANDTNPNNNPVCGRTVHVFGINSEKTVEAVVVERCSACGNAEILLSPAPFEVLTGRDNGGTPVEWYLKPTQSC